MWGVGMGWRICRCGAEREPGTFFLGGKGAVTEWRWMGMDGADEVEAE